MRGDYNNGPGFAARFQGFTALQREGHPQFQGGGRLQHGPPQLTLVSLSQVVVCCVTLLLSRPASPTSSSKLSAWISHTLTIAMLCLWFRPMPQNSTSLRDFETNLKVKRTRPLTKAFLLVALAGVVVAVPCSWALVTLPGRCDGQSARISWKVAHGVWHVSSPRLLALCIVTVVDLLLRSRHT